MPDITTDPLTTNPASFTTGKILDLWSRTANRFQRSRKRIGYVRGVINGEHGVVRPDLATGADPADDPLTTRLAQRKSIVLTEANRLSEQKPYLERRAIGGSPQAVEDAEHLELYINTAVDNALSTDECYLKAVEDGEWGVLALPRTAHFEQCPDYMETLEEEDYAKLDKKEQEQITLSEKGDDGKKRYRRPRKEYHRDSKDRPTDHEKYGKRHEANTKKSWEEAYKAYLATKPPWVVRIISAMDCAPILETGTDKRRFECTGLIVRTRFDREDLVEKGYVWEGKDNPSLVPLGFDADNPSNYGAYGQVYLYEAYKMVDGCPMVAYSVGGLETKRKTQGGEEAVDAVFNLKDEYGVSRLMAGYYFGLHLGADDPDMRGVPLLEPLASTIVGAESIITATNVYGWKNSHSGYFLPIDEKSPREAYLEQDGRLRKFQMPNAGEVVTVPGVPVPAAKAEVGDTARYVLEMLLGQIAQERPDEKVEGADSGHGMNVAAHLSQMAERQILEGVRECREDVGQWILEIACAVKRAKNLESGIPVEVNEEMMPGADNPDEPKSRYRTLELMDRWVGNNYKLTAMFPQKGNIAEVQQEADLADRGYSHSGAVLEKKGVKNVAAEMAKIAAEQILTKTPEGQMAMLINALRWRGESEKAAALELQLEQRLSQFGMPTAAMGGGQQQQQGQVPGTALPNAAASTLGGIVAGETGQAQMMADSQAMASAPQSPNGGV